nr:MAG TPA: hypothetical protein [Caudoviricetes sp.]
MTAQFRTATFIYESNNLYSVTSTNAKHLRTD